jgi:hypothetical protein
MNDMAKVMRRGNGFMVLSSFSLMTNNHILTNIDDCKNSIVNFVIKNLKRYPKDPVIPVPLVDRNPKSLVQIVYLP